MSDSTTYIIVTAESLEALATAVEAKKQEGYVVSGAPYVTDTGYAQSMILASALSPIDFPESVVDITGAYIGSRTKESGNPVYYVGDKVEPEEYSATLELKSGATRSLFQDDFYVSPREISSTSDTTVKVIYKWEKGFEDAVTIAPKAVELTSIVVQDMPRKTTYVAGQTFTGVDGLEVTALYNNNSLKRLPVGSYTVNTEDVNTSAAGTYDVIVSYTEGSITKTVTFNIEVVVNAPVALEVLGNAKLQYVGKPIDATGLTFKATMLDGSVKGVTEDVTSDATEALTDIGTKKVTFSYTENDVTASVVKYFNVTTMKPVALTMTGEFATQYINTAVNLTGLAFKVVYDNGDVADVTSSIMVTPSTWSSTVGIQAVVFTYSASGVTLTLTKSVEVREAQQGSSYLKYSSTTPFKFAPVEWVDPEDDGEGEEIVPTGTFNNVYLNCDATVEEVEEAFGAIPSEQWAGDDWDQYANSYFAFCAGVIGTDPADAILIQKSELSSGNYGYGVMFMGIGSSSSMQYIFMPEQVQEMGVPEAGWYTYDPNTSQFTKTSGIKEFTPDEPRVGMSRIEVEAYSLSYDVGLSNDKLKKIFSFNKTFSTVGYQPVSADTTRWDGTLQYHIGSEPSENTEWIDFPAEGEACDWIEVGSDPGKKIVPTGTFTKVYLNCDATVEEVEEAFGAIPENQFTGSENWGEWMYKYFAFSAGLYVESSGLKTYSSIMIGKLGTIGWMVSFLDYDERKKDYYFFSEAIPESPFSEPGWYDGNTYEKLTGVIEFADATTEGPQQGSSHISASVAGYSVSYDVGLSNDLLTKIFSFNEPFGEAVEPNLYIRGIDNSTIVGEEDLVTFQTKAIGSSSPQISLSGKLMALFDYNNPESAHLPDGEYGVQYLFVDDENLTDASELILPSTLAEPVDEGESFSGCLSYLFSGCTSLTTAPATLPATLLAKECYTNMFSGCTSLTTAPELPATTLADGCYYCMFEGCTSLTTAPTLLATDLTSYCYNNMFSGCAALTAIPELPATTLAASCYYHMFDGCTSIKLSQSQTEECQTLYRIPREGTGITADSALDGMFSGAIYDPEDGWLDEDGTPDFTSGSWEGYVGFEPPTPQSPNYLKYSSTTPFKFAPVTSYSGEPISADDPRWDGTLQYHVGSEPSRDVDWTDFPKTGACSWIEAEKGDDNNYNVYIRGGGNTTVIGEWNEVSFLTQTEEGGDGVSISGNIMALFDSTDPDDVTLSGYALYGMFRGDENIVDASELVLPATELADDCYEEMFEGCTSLASAPSELPATTLAGNCYQSMFSGCTSLTAAPELPATELADYCYQSMFSGCTSLSTAPNLPATELAEDCYEYMFQNCTSLTIAPSLSATTLAEDCCRSMFQGCTSLTTAPSLSATTLAEDCYWYMFSGCTSLTTPPSLPATTLKANCYGNMFEGCTSLTTAPSLPATTLMRECYAHMFKNCTSLAAAPELPATTAAQGCYNSMFYGCTSLETLPKVQLTGSNNNVCRLMFQGCSKIKLSTTQTGDYQTEYPIPNLTGDYALTDMFTSTGGDFKGTPTAGATYYTSNTVVPPTPPSSKLPVGGTIFYEDTTADGVYKLYDENLAETTTLSEARYYEVTTPGTKDKYYVYDSTTGLVGNNKKWGYRNITTGATTDAIGSGKTNTATILAIEDASGYYSGSIWEYLANTQNAGSGVAGYKDWFVGSNAEQDKLRESGLVNFYANQNPWSSVEVSATGAYRWNKTNEEWVNTSKSDGYYSVIFFRAF